jgi:hypothetical protein
LFEGLVEPPGSAGQMLTFQQIHDAIQTDLVNESRTRNLARAAVVEIPPLDRSGFFQIKDGSNVIGEFAANFFDSTESNLTRLRSGNRLPPVDDQGTAYTIENPFTWAILTGLALIMVLAFVDWYVVGPRKSAAA